MKIDKTFTQASTAWERIVWARHDERVIDDVLVDLSWYRGYCTFTISFVKLQDFVAAKVEMWDDGWRVFRVYPELADFFYKFHSRSNEDSATPEKMIAALVRMGFEPSEYHGQLQKEGRAR